MRFNYFNKDGPIYSIGICRSNDRFHENVGIVNSLKTFGVEIDDV